MKMTVAEIAKAVSAQNDVSAYKDVSLTSVAFDTRKLTAGALFVPLVGNNDGHDYIQSAINQGARAAFWQVGHPNRPTNFPLIEVKDPLLALQTLSKYYLRKINPTVVSITGSNGKTTTKDMVASILSTQYNVTKTQANFNNEIGVPITILSMAANTEMLVVEMGMDRPGQLDFLSHLVEPDVALITMIGEAHIEFFGTRERIADAKMEITDGLQHGGVFVYNGDEPLLAIRAQNVAEEQVTFGRGDNNTIYSFDDHNDEQTTTFKVNLWPTIEFEIPMLGDYNVNNALAALLVGELFEVPVDKMQKALRHPQLTANRTEWLIGHHGEKILSDVYNSNPTAVKAVLKAFATTTSAKGKRVIVLGDMLELGKHSSQMHAELASYINPYDFTDVYLIGPEMSVLFQALKAKYDDQHLHYYQADQIEQLNADLDANLNSADEVLLKASHGIHLEKTLGALIK